MQKSRFRPKKASAEYLLIYVNNLISNNDKENGHIGVLFQLDIRKHNYENLGIPRDSKSRKILYYNDNKFSFNYNFMKIYLFETNVGF